MEHRKIVIFINKTKYELASATQTGRTLKEAAHIALTDVLFLDAPGADEVVPNDATLEVKPGSHFHSSPPANYGAHGPVKIVIFINKTKYELASVTQTGRTLKEVAHIALTDVLFLEAPGEDEVIPNDATLEVKPGSHFHSSPPANYGNAAAATWTERAGHAGAAQLHEQPDGWQFLVLLGFTLPAAYTPRSVNLLVKLPPTFPDAAPDMFWVEPHVHLASGAVPASTSGETLLGRVWQRFSWHLQQGAWKVGQSDLRDFIRCVRARFQTGT